MKKLDIIANDLFINMLKSSFEVSTTERDKMVSKQQWLYPGRRDGIRGE